MRPLTEQRPKPMIALMGRPLIDRILDRLEAAGVRKVVVNTHHLAERLEAHLARRDAPAIETIREEAILDTGGGVANALDRLAGDAFYVLNGDVFWLDGRAPALLRLARQWDPARMDALLLLNATAGALGYDGPGDFQLDTFGQARRRLEFEVAPFAFTGVQILHRRLFDYAPEGAFSLNLLYDQAEAAERLHGLRHDGLWFHVGTPEDLELAEAELYDLGFRKDRDEDAA
jgi:MurNAc alpha-1-phosphate uridylyltransferase